ncbi:hypothetical protein GCM10025858_11840 [Alicyclobacillus sacchari]|nr:hypothetical protein GCM10025858_11840 [Alicyclobacillus sacchari]
MSTTEKELGWIERLADEFEEASPEKIIEEALKRVPNLTFACSFGAEDMVLLDMLMNIDPEANVFYLDTNVLFQETYDLRDRAIEKYGIPNLRQVLALTLEQQEEQYGEALWGRDPNQCCNIRKVQPLTNVLKEYDGWITAFAASKRRHARTPRCSSGTANSI